jgi:hypothetical protein
LLDSQLRNVSNKKENDEREQENVEIKKQEKREVRNQGKLFGVARRRKLHGKGDKEGYKRHPSYNKLDLALFVLIHPGRPYAFQVLRLCAYPPIMAYGTKKGSSQGEGAFFVLGRLTLAYCSGQKRAIGRGAELIQVLDNKGTLDGTKTLDHHDVQGMARLKRHVAANERVTDER